MKKTLIIGGGGYIGCILTDFFLKKNHFIICADNFIFGHKNSVKKFKHNKNFKSLHLDLRKKNLKTLPQKVDNVILLAGLVGDPITKKYKEEAKQINEFGIKRVINFYRKKKVRFIFVSTCSNYGVSKKIATEKTKLNPKSLYAKQKVKIEKYILGLKRKSIFEPVILRFATAFGISERLRFDLTLNEFVLYAYLKRKVEIYDHKTWRPYCHVKDFAKVIFKCLVIKKKNIYYEIFNVGSESNNSRKIDLAKKIKKSFPKFKYEITNTSKDARDYRVSFLKLKRKLNIKNFVSIKEGIKEIKQFLKKSNNSKSLLKFGNFRLTK